MSYFNHPTKSWTTSPPKQEGYYWWKEDKDDDEPEIAFVFEDNGRLVVEDYDSEIWVGEIGGYFSGPLIPPQ